MTIARVARPGRRPTVGVGPSAVASSSPWTAPMRCSGWTTDVPRAVQVGSGRSGSSLSAGRGPPQASGMQNRPEVCCDPLVGLTGDGGTSDEHQIRPVRNVWCLQAKCLPEETLGAVPCDRTADLPADHEPRPGVPAFGPPGHVEHQHPTGVGTTRGEDRSEGRRRAESGERTHGTRRRCWRGPWHGDGRERRDRHGCAYEGGSRGSWPASGCWAGRCASRRLSLVVRDHRHGGRDERFAPEDSGCPGAAGSGSTRRGDCRGRSPSPSSAGFGPEADGRGTPVVIQMGDCSADWLEAVNATFLRCA